VGVVCADTDTHQATGEWAGHFDVVTARSFGTPEQTARAAGHYLKPGGLLLVSEPPGSTGARWDSTRPEFTLGSVNGGIAALRRT
jgi:16S rRNA G527 N7-methylase RsmG